MADEESEFMKSPGQNLSAWLLALGAGFAISTPVKGSTDSLDPWQQAAPMGMGEEETRGLLLLLKFPAWADFIARHEDLKWVVPWALAPVFAVSYAALHTSPAEKAFLLILMTGLGSAVITRLHTKGKI